MSGLRIPVNLVRQIEREGSAAYPNECCGIMYGTDTKAGRQVDSIEAVPNVYDEVERYHRFSISPQQLMAAEKKAGEQGKLVLGFYHSHPDHPARPSETDRIHAWPFYSYVIVAITKREPTDITSWLLDEVTETFSRQDILES